MANLRQDVIEGAQSDSIEATADELLGMTEDRVRVLGTSQLNEFIESDQDKGLLDKNFINVCSTLFGVQAQEVFKLVEK